MKKKILIPNRGAIALDIIDSFKSLDCETILLHSPEDASSLAVKLADRSYKFYSSRIEDSYMDIESIIEKALELKVDYIHPGYGFLAEEPEFSRACKQNGIGFIGPDADILEIVRDKISLRKLARDLGVDVLGYYGPIKSIMDFEPSAVELKAPWLVKPVKGSGGRGFKIIDNKREVPEQLQEMLKRERNQRDGLMFEEFHADGHHIEVPFFRDAQGNILMLPEIESSIQRRFQKIFQESPSVNISEETRQLIYKNSRKIIEKIQYTGLGYTEFIVTGDHAYFSELNPGFQINSLVPEIHLIANFIKKQFALVNGERLHDAEGIRIVEPKLHIMLVSLMAENPFDNFQPSSGVVTEFYSYSTIRNIFKTHLYAGAKMSPLYDPFIGKILTFTRRRENTLKDMRNFLNNIIIKGVKTNLPFLRSILSSDCMSKGDTIIDFVNQKCNFSTRRRSDEETHIAAALLSAAFHMENRKNNYKAKLESMKQPGLLKRLFNRM